MLRLPHERENLSLAEYRDNQRAFIRHLGRQLRQLADLDPCRNMEETARRTMAKLADAGNPYVKGVSIFEIMTETFVPGSFDRE